MLEVKGDFQESLKALGVHAGTCEEDAEGDQRRSARRRRRRGRRGPVWTTCLARGGVCRRRLGAGCGEGSHMYSAERGSARRPGIALSNTVSTYKPNAAMQV